MTIDDEAVLTWWEEEEEEKADVVDDHDGHTRAIGTRPHSGEESR